MTTVLAIYGAIVATIAAFAAIWNAYRDRSRLKLVEFTVTTRMGFFRILFTLANAGRRPITIRDFSLNSSDGGSFELARSLWLVNSEIADERDRMGPIPEIRPQVTLRLDEGERCDLVVEMDRYPAGLTRPPKWLE